MYDYESVFASPTVGFWLFDILLKLKRQQVFSCQGLLLTARSNLCAQVLYTSQVDLIREDVRLFGEILW